MSLVLGLDLGGTTTRAVLADTDGALLGTGRAGPGNPFAHPPALAAAAMSDAVRQALGSHDPAHVTLGVLGMAGGGALREPTAATQFANAWHALGLRAPMRVVSDPAVAFAAGTARPSGTVLIAGTGAVAAAVEEHRTTRSVGGHGWLLSDEGAGFWLGREAVRALLAVFDGQREPGVLTDLVHGTLLPTVARRAGSAEVLLNAVDHAQPLRLAGLAPLVSQAASAGDPTAAEIVAQATTHLIRLVAATRDGETGAPVVLAGSVVAPGTPVGEALRRRLADRWPIEPRTAGAGAAGAAWLAAIEADPSADRAALHRLLVG